MRGRPLLLILGLAACQGKLAPTPARTDPSIPTPAPVGALAQPAPPTVAPRTGAEARGIPAPTGSLGLDVYRARRRALMQKAGTAAVLVLNEASWDGARGGMDFYYLTGFDEPGAALLLTPGAPIYKETLFLEGREIESERWEGERAPLPNRAMEVATGFAKISRKSSLVHALVTACERYKALAYAGDFAPGENKTLGALREAAGATMGCEVRDLHGTIARMREAHDEAELALMRKAIDHTRAGHAAALVAVKPGAREYEVKEAIEAAFRKSGSRHLAFDSITGSGPNAAVLHYPKDDRAMNEGELIVVDIGAEAEGYAADITRTLPVGPSYSKDQRDIIDIVLRAQEAGRLAAKLGARLEDVDRATRDVIAEAGYYDYYWHRCCHYVGLEVHDAGRPFDGFVAGTVITIEPGIYLPQAGFGVRIEDEYLITPNGAECLTCDIPKTPDEIERAKAGAR